MPEHTPLERRSFLGRLTVGAAAFGAALAGGAATPSIAAAAGSRRTAGHPEDAWLDEMKGMHRVVYDGTTIENGHNVWFYARNFLNANNSGYKLKDSDCSIVGSVRHHATFFGYNDAMWAKYPIAEMGKVEGKPRVNPHTADAKELAARGVVISVCGLATGFFDDVQKELAAYLVIPGSHLMAAGVVAVTRAQEHGFTYTYVG
jgi:hypothetical protein